jgi:hypothetical protein
MLYNECQLQCNFSPSPQQIIPCFCHRMEDNKDGPSPLAPSSVGRSNNLLSVLAHACEEGWYLAWQHAPRPIKILIDWLLWWCYFQCALSWLAYLAVTIVQYVVYYFVVWTIALAIVADTLILPMRDIWYGTPWLWITYLRSWTFMISVQRHLNIHTLGPKCIHFMLEILTHIVLAS